MHAGSPNRDESATRLLVAAGAGHTRYMLTAPRASDRAMQARPAAAWVVAGAARQVGRQDERERADVGVVQEDEEEVRRQQRQHGRLRRAAGGQPAACPQALRAPRLNAPAGAACPARAPAVRRCAQEAWARRGGGCGARGTSFPIPLKPQGLGPWPSVGQQHSLRPRPGRAQRRPRHGRRAAHIGRAGRPSNVATLLTGGPARACTPPGLRARGAPAAPRSRGPGAGAGPGPARA